MYEKFVEKTDGTTSRSLIKFFTSNPSFTTGSFILFLLVIGAFYGLTIPGDKYVDQSEFTQEYRIPPTFRPYIFVSKKLDRTSIDLSTNISTRSGLSGRDEVEWIRKLASYHPQSTEVVLTNIEGRPKVFPAHPFGTDSQGRDVLSRTLASIRVYPLPCLIAIVFSVSLGLLFGIFGADIWTGWLAKLRFFLQCLMDVLEALPKYITILLAIILIPPAARQFQWYGIHWYRFYWLSIIIGVLSAPKLGKLIMERIDLLKKREFIEAADAIGMSKFRVALKHVIRYNCLTLLLTQAAALVTEVIMAEIVLSYLTEGRDWGRGITVVEPNPSLGNILVNARHYLFDSWWISFFPLFILVLWISAAYMFAHGVNRMFVQRRNSIE